MWPEKQFGGLIEAKALVAHSEAKVRSDIRAKVAPDLDAMLGIEPRATMNRAPGKYEDPDWSLHRAHVERLYALQFVLVHGVAALACEALLAEALQQSVARVVDGYIAARPSWAAVLQDAYTNDPLFQRRGGEGPTAALLSAWVIPLPWNLRTDVVGGA